MKLMIDIPEEDYEAIKDGSVVENITIRTGFGSICKLPYVFEAIRNGIPLSKDTTNGDMLKAIFPNIDVRLFTNANIVQTKIQEFDSHWWNAPYKAESEDKYENR